MSWDGLNAGPAWLALGFGALATAVLTGMWILRRRQNVCAATPTAKACSISTDSSDAGACGCASSRS
jgi:hypothetical protein